MIRSIYIFGFLLLCLCCTTSFAKGRTDQNVKRSRDGKLLSLFQIIRFPNSPCIGGASKNGTCYTADECAQRSGTNAGSCAQGYGVCCTFTAGCGGTSNENCTYFESSGSEIGACQLEICRCNDKICQLRLDFNQFVISGPSTSTVTIGKAINGEIAGSDAGSTVTSASQCMTDVFSVSNPGGGTPPSICGINSGEHMYVDSSDCCNDLTFQLGTKGVGTSIGQRMWSIKITQYSCDFPNLAPPGCTQYFFGSDSQTVQTYNFQGGQHLANQEQTICIRRERGNCRICWTTANPMTDFAVSATAAKGVVTMSKCCRYTAAGVMGISGNDCVTIPGALTAMMNTKQLALNRFCGRSVGLVTADSMTEVTVCSDRTPFELNFFSDTYEPMIEAMTMKNVGFRLTYIQEDGTCNNL